MSSSCQESQRITVAYGIAMVITGAAFHSPSDPRPLLVCSPESRKVAIKGKHSQVGSPNSVTQEQAHDHTEAIVSSYSKIHLKATLDVNYFHLQLLVSQPLSGGKIWLYNEKDTPSQKKKNSSG